MSDEVLPPKPQSPQEYIAIYEQDALMWLADRRLANINEVQRNERFTELAHLIASVNKPVNRDDYSKKIARKYSLTPAVFKKMIDDAIEVNKKKEQIKKSVRKNEIPKLEGKANTYPFFYEELTKDGDLKQIRVNKVRFIELLRSFGFSRFAVGDRSTDYTFVKMQDNIISVVTADDIADHLETFIRGQYDFVGAEMEHVNAEMLINKLYDGMNVFFSSKLFARIRNESPIIINQDKATITYLYYRNGFVEVTDKGYELKPYDQMEGSVWEDQMLDRDFEKLDNAMLPAGPIEGDEKAMREIRNYKSDFVDFCWKISNCDTERFKTLLGVIGYLVHDFYDYKLKAILFTDSSLSEYAEGRTGKTLLMKILSQVRSLTEINGKDFKADEKGKYEDVQLGTQIVHLNDVKHKGKNAFDFENVFNDITEGMIVNAKYVKPFRKLAKMAISTNKSLNIVGDSQRDRVVEFELSDFFSAKRSPEQFYGRWLVRDWDKDQWRMFDNFICLCAQHFHQCGLVHPPTINLEERKLRDHTPIEFVDFMSERVDAKLKANEEPEFEAKDLYEDFKKQYVDFNTSRQPLQQRTFTRWLRMFGQYRCKGNFKERKSAGKMFFQFEYRKTS